MQKLSTSIIINPDNNLMDPSSWPVCYISNLENELSYRADISQISTLLTYQEVVQDKKSVLAEGSKELERISKIIHKKIAKIPLKTIEAFMLESVNLMFFLNSDGGSQQLSDNIEYICKQTKKANGSIYSFVGHSACGSSGLGFFLSDIGNRFTLSSSTVGLTLNQIEQLFVEKQSQLKYQYEHYTDMNKVVTKRISKITEIITSATLVQHREKLLDEVQKQLPSSHNTRSCVTLSASQIQEFQLATISTQHYTSLSNSVDVQAVETIIQIPEIEFFLNQEIVTYH